MTFTGLRFSMKNMMLKVSYALILDFFTALSLLNVPLQKIEATPKICDSYRTGNEKELRYPDLHCRRFQPRPPKIRLHCRLELC